MSSYSDLSVGAQKIYRLLKENNSQFMLEYSPDDLKSHKGHKLRFDFAVRHDAQFTLIEFDGEQHFKNNKYFFKTPRKFKEAQERDRIKNGYCLAHNIPLFRIPFFDIDNIVHVEQLFQNKYRVRSIYHNDQFRY